MADDPKQTTDAGNNPTGDPKAALDSVMSVINDDLRLIKEVSERINQLNKLGEMWLAQDEELKRLHEKFPNLEGWQLALIKGNPKDAAEFIPRYLEMRKKWDGAVEEYYKKLKRISDATLETYDGKEWADLLSEHPEFADKCDWAKLSDEDWASLLEKQPQFADKRGK